MTPSLPWYRLCAAFGHGADAEGTHASRKRGKQCANTSKRPNCCMFLSCPEMYRLLPPVRHDPGYRSAAKPMYTYITLHTTPRHRACATGTHLAGHTRGTDACPLFSPPLSFVHHGEDGARCAGLARFEGRQLADLVFLVGACIYPFRASITFRGQPTWS